MCRGPPIVRSTERTWCPWWPLRATGPARPEGALGDIGPGSCGSGSSVARSAGSRGPRAEGGAVARDDQGRQVQDPLPLLPQLRAVRRVGVVGRPFLGPPEVGEG